MFAVVNTPLRCLLNTSSTWGESINPWRGVSQLPIFNSVFTALADNNYFPKSLYNIIVILAVITLVTIDAACSTLDLSSDMPFVI